MREPSVRERLLAGLPVVECRRDVAGVTVYVSDEGGAAEPRLGDMLELAESGRGLLTVDALAAAWSWKGDAGGRTVRAAFTPGGRG